jgi:hypothetical protein
MKKLILLFICIFLLGSNIYANGPDWAKFPGAKAILDNMQYSAINGISPEAAIKNNPNIYTVEHTSELLKLLDESTITLAEAKDYLSKAKAIFPIILNVNELDDIKTAWSIQELLNAAEKKLINMPTRRLLERLGKKDVKEWDLNPSPLRDCFENAYRKLLAPKYMFNENLDIRVNEADMAIILGTPEYEYNDGLLYQIYKLAADGYDYLAPIQTAIGLQVKILCTGSEQDIATLLGTIELTAGGKTLGKTLINKLSANNFSLDGKKSWETTLLEKLDLSKGLENLERITKLIENK